MNQRPLIHFTGQRTLNKDITFGSVIVCSLVLLPLQPELRTDGFCSGLYSAAVL